MYFEGAIDAPLTWQDPYPLYARLLAAEGLVACRKPTIGVRRGLAVARHAEVSEVFKDVERFRNDPHAVPGAGKSFADRAFAPRLFRAFQRTMLGVDGSEHKRLRGLASRAFTPARVRSLEDQIRAIVDDLLDAALAAGRFDFMTALALPLPLRIIAEMLGVEERERAEFHRLLGRTIGSETTLQMLARAPAMLRMVRFFDRLLARKRSEPGDDLTSALIAAEDEGDKLSAEELLGTVFLLLFAGHETTVNLIGNGTFALLTHPEQHERLRAEPSLIPTAVEEMLRFSSPAQVIQVRHVVEDCELGGHALKTGDVLVPLVGAANRDPAAFDQPARFDVGRSPNKHLAFGGGPHFCLGAHLSRIEGALAFERIVERLPRLVLDVEPSAIRWRTGALHGLTALPVRAE